MGRSMWMQAAVLISLLFGSRVNAGALLVERDTPVGTADPAAIAPWKYKGCYSDNNPAGKALGGQSFPADSSMTVESCISKCASSPKNWTIAGMEYGSQCYCDSYLRYAPTSILNSSCSTNCPGNANEKCGAGSKLSIYSLLAGDMPAWTPPTQVSTGLPDGWYSSGCWKDSGKPRVFPYLITSANNNTNLGCINLCNKFGYTAAGTEYGTQCFCGDVQDVTTAGAVKIDSGTCKTICSADTNLTTGGTICGGGSAMNLYTYNKTMYQWDYASPAEAGSYDLLFSGPIIPLVSQPGRNGKITLLEKSPGTTGTTGAYELDMFDTSSNKTAFRTMSVLSNIFCSASLTLPDKAGRQINVGGWAGPSTQGVRLYSPDGKPGVPGVQNWQENYTALHLLDHRWYPSAVIMANGSILVVGGEEGSNGDPVATLEILPDPNAKNPLPLNPIGTPTMWFKWLNDTDPYNLYPFLTVLPSGGIAVFHWNQARILDSGTFDTIKTLPDIPGSVNRPDGGRTYPLSGVAMLLPQYEPYNKEDFGVIICGGSTTGPSMPIDNCVSIKPDSPNPQWALERMPSKRVMACMTALPDGTFLITNGAMAGVAGFGLADNPNLNAVLYDPSQPFNQRMTVMANTTIARLYHSESVLLDDASILVTGSDPQDYKSKGHPQEYRYEIFRPPYLSKPRPIFKINDIDLSYGEQATFTIDSKGLGAGGPYNVTLIGSVASTHGNSMGQRTIIPTVTLVSGNTWTFKAPPNAKVCPPSWFQMFVLDKNNTPSNATWVRIGGDPAQLGNWPSADTGIKNAPGMGTATPLY